MPRRREKGQGTVYEYPEGSGRWWAKMPDDGISSPPKWRVSSKEARRLLLREKLRQREHGLQIGHVPTLTQWLDHWLTEVVQPSVKPTTYASYASYVQVVQLYIAPYLGTKRLDKLEPALLRRWVNTLAERYAPDTVRNAHARLRAVLQVAVNDRRYIEHNPTDGIKVPIADRRAPSALTASQVGQLLDAVAQHRLYALYYLALATGMREGELIGLRWANVAIDNAEPCIQVHEQLQYVDGKLVRMTPKSKNSRRDIPIDTEISVVLRAHREVQQGERDRMGDLWKDPEIVFASEVGTPLSPRNLVRHFKAALARAGLPNIRFHDLRHTAGSLMLAEGAKITDVSKLLGHSSVAVTAAIYAHSYDNNKRRAVASVALRLRHGGTNA